MSARRFGEFDWIAYVRDHSPRGRRTRQGIGDDCAVLRWDRGYDLLWTTDMIIENRHFRLNEATPEAIGRKAVLVNVSDIAAMGGRPVSCLIALGAPKKLSEAFLKKIHRGAKDACTRYGLDLAGGDTNASKELILSVSMIGEVERGKAVLRSGAQAGDTVFVTGTLGGSYRSGRHLDFKPRVKEALYLRENFRLHALMDISDGLSSDIRRICEASRVGALVDAASLPLSPGVTTYKHALNDGEDFELLFTVDERNAQRLLRHRFPTGFPRLSAVGSITPASQGVRLRCADKTVALKPSGFDHFR